MRRSSYLLKLVLLTMMVGTFPVLTLGWYSYHYSSQSVLKQMEESNAQVLRQSQLRVEQTLKMIDYSTSQVLSVPAVIKAIPVKLGIGETVLIQELYNILASIQTYELGIKDVYLFSLQQDWLITNAGIGDYGQPGLKEKLRSYSGAPQGSFWVSVNSAKLLGEQGPVELEHAVMSVKKWPINSANPRGFIGVVLSANQLKQLIAGEPLPGGTMFIVDSDNKVLAHSDDAMLGKDLSGVSYIRTLRQEQGETGVLKDKEENEAVSVSYRKSAYNDWTYISVVPTRSITREATAIGWTSILVSIGVLAATVIAALIGSRKVYSPVRKISRVLLDGKAGEGKKDELSAISDRIEGILSDQSKLKFELEGQQKQLVELLERKLLLGEAKGKEIRERLLEYGCRQTEQWEKMRVLLFQIDRLDGGRFLEKDRDLLLFAVGNIAAELIPEGERLPPVVIQDSVVVLIGARAQSEEAFKETVFNLAVKVQSSVKDYLQLQTSIGISRSFLDWGDTGRGYVEGENALKYRARLGEEAVLFIEDVQPHESRDTVYPKEQSDELLDAVKNLDAERADAALSGMMEALSNQNVDHNDYQLALMRLLMELVRLLQDAGISLHMLELRENALLEELLKLHTGREIEAWFTDTIVHPGIRLLEERRQAQFTSISQEVKRMIEEAFDTDLTLEKCSAKINYHPQYISRVFRQETGITFADYLAQYRLEVAKRWLQETDLTITDIAEKLKYNNPANFIRYFRKMEGMTPGQFREKNR